MRQYAAVSGRKALKKNAQNNSRNDYADDFGKINDRVEYMHQKSKSIQKSFAPLPRTEPR